VESRTLRAGRLRGLCVCVVVSIAALVPAIVPAGASATSPVLEFVVPGNSFPVDFTAAGGEVTAALSEFETVVHCTGSSGGGEITGPRSTVSNYVFTGCETQGGTDGGRKCKTASASDGEITATAIEAELVYIDQAKHEVGMLLDPHGGDYLNFECAGESVKAIGPFLSPVGPINQEAMSFTASLSRSGAMQTPDEYENANGEKLLAIPTGERGTHPSATTGVELSFTISPTVPLEIKAINVAELEAKHQEEEAATAAAAKKHQEEEATAAAAKKQQEEEAAKAAAAKKHQEEEAAAKKRKEAEKAKSKRPTRAQLLTKALKQCKKAKSKHKRAQCEKLAKKKYGSQGKHKTRKK
jgi:hypothetical protein